MSSPNSPDRFNEDKSTFAVRGGGEAPDLAAGVAAIRNVLETLPIRPGVYRMQDARGDVLYVGKARALRNRVANYVQVERLTKRVAAADKLCDVQALSPRLQRAAARR